MKADITASPADINWGGSGFNPYDVFASAAAVASPATGEGAPASPAPGVQPASPAGGQQPAAPSTASPNEENLRVMRENYERYKTENEKWSQLGKHDEIAPVLQAVNKQKATYADFAKRLGYDSSEFEQTFRTDPFGVMRLLNREWQQAMRDGRVDGQAYQLEKRLQQMVEEKTAPLNEAMNRQATDRANQLFETTTRDLIANEFKGASPESQPFLDLLFDATSELLKYDDAALTALKTQGQTAGIKKAFSSAKEMIMKAFVAWQKLDTAGAQRGPGAIAPAAAGSKRLTLDDIINDTPAAQAAIPSMRR